MHVLYLGYHFDDALGTVEALLRRYAMIPMWCESVKGAGIERVTVMQRFKTYERFERNGVRYVILRDGLPGKLSPWHQARLLHDFVASESPDVIHVNGGVFQIPSLRRSVGPSAAILWQHHAGFPSTTLKRMAYRAAMARCDGFLFASDEIGNDWRDAGIIRPEQMVYEVMEASTMFSPLSQRESQQKLALVGQPMFLWVGRLNANKDPASVIQGFAATVNEFSDPMLYLVYHECKLLTAVEALIGQLRLGARVHLVGEINHDSMPAFYSAADYFVLGSHSEGSGFALLEALACGCTPVVTDIPSFRRITKGGSIGALWEPGNSSSFAEALRKSKRGSQTRTAIRSFFEENWSWPVLGRAAADAYCRSDMKRKQMNLLEGNLK